MSLVSSNLVILPAGHGFQVLKIVLYARVYLNIPFKIITVKKKKKKKISLVLKLSSQENPKKTRKLIIRYRTKLVLKCDLLSFLVNKEPFWFILKNFFRFKKGTLYGTFGNGSRKLKEPRSPLLNQYIQRLH